MTATLTPRRATPRTRAVLTAAGLIESTGKIASHWSDGLDWYRGPAPLVQTVVSMRDPANREDAIDALTTAFDDVTKVERWEGHVARRSHCSFAIYRRANTRSGPGLSLGVSDDEVAE